MSVNSRLELSLIGWSTEDVPSGPREPTLYRVTGLSPDDHCTISFAGIGIDGERKWSISWFRSARKIETADTLFDTPEDALKEVSEVYSQRSQD